MNHDRWWADSIWTWDSAEKAHAALRKRRSHHLAADIPWLCDGRDWRRTADMMGYMASRTELNFSAVIYHAENFKRFLQRSTAELPVGHGWRMYREFGVKTANIAFGVPVESQATADREIPILASIPSASRFALCEFMPGKSLDLSNLLACELDKLIIAHNLFKDDGGEYRKWVAAIRGQAKNSRVQVLVPMSTRTISPRPVSTLQS